MINTGEPLIKVSFCCLMSTEARWPIRDGDKWEKGDRRVKPRNRRQPGRPRLPWTAARTTGCYGSVRLELRSDHHTTQLLSQLLCGTVTKTIEGKEGGKEEKERGKRRKNRRRKRRKKRRRKRVHLWRPVLFMRPREHFKRGTCFAKVSVIDSTLFPHADRAERKLKPSQ